MEDEQSESRINGKTADVLEALIFQRRSVRKYKRDPLPESWIEAILRCAHQAPSPSNSQPVRFVRIISPDCRHRLEQALAHGHGKLIDRHQHLGAHVRLRNWINAYRRYAEFMFSAPELLAVGVTTETVGFSNMLSDAGLLVENVGHSRDLDMTVGLALKGLILKAHALGVGSCILTAPLVFIPNVEQVLNLKNIGVKCFVTLGVAAEASKPTNRLPLDSVVQVV